MTVVLNSLKKDNEMNSYKRRVKKNEGLLSLVDIVEMMMMTKDKSWKNDF